MANVIKSNSPHKVVNSKRNDAMDTTRFKFNQTPKVVNSKVNFTMDTTRFKFNQTPVETPNGVITVFTLPSSDSYVSGLIEVFLDGLLQS